MFLPISFYICFGCSKEPSHRDGSFEYPQHMFWLRNKKIIFLVRTLSYASSLTINQDLRKSGEFVIFTDLKMWTKLNGLISSLLGLKALDI